MRWRLVCVVLSCLLLIPLCLADTTENDAQSADESSSKLPTSNDEQPTYRVRILLPLRMFRFWMNDAQRAPEVSLLVRILHGFLCPTQLSTDVVLLYTD